MVLRDDRQMRENAEIKSDSDSFGLLCDDFSYVRLNYFEGRGCSAMWMLCALHVLLSLRNDVYIQLICNSICKLDLLGFLSTLWGNTVNYCIVKLSNVDTVKGWLSSTELVSPFHCLKQVLMMVMFRHILRLRSAEGRSLSVSLCFSAEREGLSVDGRGRARADCPRVNRLRMVFSQTDKEIKVKKC